MRHNLVLSMSVPTVVILKEKYSAPNRTHVEKTKGL